MDSIRQERNAVAVNWPPWSHALSRVSQLRTRWPSSGQRRVMGKSDSLRETLWKEQRLSLNQKYTFFAISQRFVSSWRSCSARRALPYICSLSCKSTSCPSIWPLHSWASDCRASFIAIQWAYNLTMICSHLFPNLWATVSVFNIGYFGYLTEHSTRNTIERDTAIAWAVRSARYSNFMTRNL